MKKRSFSHLENILADHTSGSSELLRRLNNYFLKNINHITDLTDTIKLLQNHFKSFQNIRQYLDRLKKISSSKMLSEFFFTEFQLTNESVYDKIFANALPFLRDKKTILTISNSSTIFEILQRLSEKRRIQIFICESRPKFEGRLLAKKLTQEKINVGIITEAMSAIYVQRCDCVLVGADTILSSGEVFNKVGSFQLALLCKHFQKPFYVITERSKYSLKNNFQQITEPSNQIWNKAPDGISIRNL